VWLWCFGAGAGAGACAGACIGVGVSVWAEWECVRSGGEGAVRVRDAFCEAQGRSCCWWMGEASRMLLLLAPPPPPHSMPTVEMLLLELCA